MAMIEIMNRNRKWFQFWKPKTFTIGPPAGARVIYMSNSKPVLPPIPDSEIKIIVEELRKIEKENRINKKEYENIKR